MEPLKITISSKISRGRCSMAKRARFDLLFVEALLHKASLG